MTLNTGEYPSVAEESTLSQILQANAPEKYYLSARACQGILNRASKRGKTLPPMLKEALEEVVSLQSQQLTKTGQNNQQCQLSEQMNQSQQDASSIKNEPVAQGGKGILTDETGTAFTLSTNPDEYVTHENANDCAAFMGGARC